MRPLACTLGLAAALVLPTAAGASPTPMTAWYMYGDSASVLRSYAYSHGCSFAKDQPDASLRVLLLDFGAARKIDSSTWGAVDFSNTRFSHAEILAAPGRTSGRLQHLPRQRCSGRRLRDEQLPPLRLRDVHDRRVACRLPP